LLVVLTLGSALTDGFVAQMKQELLSQVSPRHVPGLILGVPKVPRTLSGKKLEVGAAVDNPGRCGLGAGSRPGWGGRPRLPHPLP
jgi:acetoacetyl-CoA synthetase